MASRLSDPAYPRNLMSFRAALEGARSTSLSAAQTALLNSLAAWAAAVLPDSASDAD